MKRCKRTWTDRKIKVPEPTHEELDKLVEEYLDRGGTITKLVISPENCVGGMCDKDML